MRRGELPEPLIARRLPKDIGAHKVLHMCYRGEIALTPQQLRAAMAAALEGETPKVQVVGHSAGDVAERLEQAVRRSGIGQS
jgi:hypothetical protein